MKTNMGLTDRLIRLIVAVVMGVFIFTGALIGVMSCVLFLVAGYFIVTSFWGYCPIYAPFHISTKTKFEVKSRTNHIK